MEEIFKPIPNYPNYQVSNMGNIIGFHKRKMKQGTNGKSGYRKVSINQNGVPKCFTVHRLVALTFLGESALQVDHINGIKTDNRLENLRYCTQRQNLSSYHKTRNTTSKYIGVSWCKLGKKWRSMIWLNRKLYSLGYFNCELKAHEAYQNKLKEITQSINKP